MFNHPDTPSITFPTVAGQKKWAMWPHLYKQHLKETSDRTVKWLHLGPEANGPWDLILPYSTTSNQAPTGGEHQSVCGNPEVTVAALELSMAIPWLLG